MKVPPRSKPSLANMMLIVAFAVTVLCLYVASYGTGALLLGRGTIGLDQMERLEQTVFAPLAYYARTELPGGSTISTLWSWMYWLGAGHPQDWRELSAALAERKAECMLK